MENNYFYRKFQRKADSELQRILNDPKFFTDDAVQAAIQILKERGVELTENQRAVGEKIKEKENAEKEVNRTPAKESEFPLIAKRIVAFILDLGILSLISFLLGFIFIGTPFVEDPWELLVSWMVITGYFVFFNGVAGSSTPGKRIMKIRTENYESQPVGFVGSMVRYGLLFTPYFLLEFLDSLSFNSFGLLTGLRFVYYVGIVYFVVTDKGLRRSFHDLMSKSYVTSENQAPLSFGYSGRKVKIFWFVATGIVVCFMATNLSIRAFTADLADFDSQIQQLEATLSENKDAFSLMISGIQNIEGVAEIEDISLNTVNSITSLDITIRPSSFWPDDGLAEKVYESIRGTKLKIHRLDNVKVIKHFGFKMTLASFSRTETTDFEQ